MADLPAQPASPVPSPEPDRVNEHLAERLRALGHPVRLSVLRTLARENRCVCGKIVSGLPLAQSTVSQHLKVLVEAGLICSRTEGARTSYCLDLAALAALRTEIDDLFASLLSAGACGPSES